MDSGKYNANDNLILPIHVYRQWTRNVSCTSKWWQLRKKQIIYKDIGPEGRQRNCVKLALTNDAASCSWTTLNSHWTSQHFINYSKLNIGDYSCYNDIPLPTIAHNSAQIKECEKSAKPFRKKWAKCLHLILFINSSKKFLATCKRHDISETT